MTEQLEGLPIGKKIVDESDLGDAKLLTHVDSVDCPFPSISESHHVLEDRAGNSKAGGVYPWSLSKDESVSCWMPGLG